MKLFGAKRLKTKKTVLQGVITAGRRNTVTALTNKKIKLNLTIESLSARKNFPNINQNFSEQHPSISLY